MMMGGGGGELHQQLKNLCFNTDWKYAVFWKLKHQPQMMLSWEDAYCNDKEKNDFSEINNWFTNANDNLKDEWYPQDHLGLAIANMSYRVYSIGEGVVGRVAATGKHQWISGLQLVNSLCSLDEHSDGWKSQFTAGIRVRLILSNKFEVLLKNIFFAIVTLLGKKFRLTQSLPSGSVWVAFKIIWVRLGKIF
ncbi:putative transcription factor MYC/MYB, transcription factor LHW [Helianthus annuus]|nr:putative transcription factor MYC/MYB, transcription factor LHW [Helianthus annuus]KAJ0761663.1 putative transcription factor MYC/MYB, transcription factor LHW [Helianthus annuus]